MMRRLPWLVAAGIVAAAASDPLVESIADTGVFGRGFTDNNHAAVVPALVAGCLIALLVAFARLHEAYRHAFSPSEPEASAGGRADRFATLLTAFASASRLRDAYVVCGVQFASIYGIESVEAAMTDGRLADGFGWLGGPLAVALPAHVAIGTAAFVALGAIARWLASGIATFVCSALRSFWLAASRRPAFAAGRRANPHFHAAAPRSRATRGRAPPSRLRTHASPL